MQAIQSSSPIAQSTEMDMEPATEEEERRQGVWDGTLKTKAVIKKQQEEEAQQQEQQQSHLMNNEQLLLAEADGMTPFNTPYTPFSLRQFMTLGGQEKARAKTGATNDISNNTAAVAEGTTASSIQSFLQEVVLCIRTNRKTDAALMILSQVLLPVVWFTNSLDRIIVGNVPSIWLESVLFFQVKTVVISAITLTVFGGASIFFFPIGMAILILSSWIWIPLLGWIVFRSYVDCNSSNNSNNSSNDTTSMSNRNSSGSVRYSRSSLSATKTDSVYHRRAGHRHHRH